MRSFTIFTALAAAFSGLAAAVTTPVGEPKGNAIIKPELGEIVPVGKPYEITWIPDTPGTVSLLLLRGPSENVVPIGAPIAEGIPNNGKFLWTPGAELEPDTLRYGIQLIVDATGQYQYSVQFGISNPGYTGGASSTTAASSTESATATDSATATATETEKYPTSTSTTTEPTTTTEAEPTTTSKAVTTTTTEEEKTTTTEVPETTTKAAEPTTLITTTQVPTTTTKPRASNTSVIIPPSVTDSGAASRFVSVGMGLLSVAVAGFVLL